jgi:hypothetical protein
MYCSAPPGRGSRWLSPGRDRGRSWRSVETGNRAQGIREGTGARCKVPAVHPKCAGYSELWHTQSPLTKLLEPHVLVLLQLTNTVTNQGVPWMCNYTRTQNEPWTPRGRRESQCKRHSPTRCEYRCTRRTPHYRKCPQRKALPLTQGSSSSGRESTVQTSSPGLPAVQWSVNDYQTHWQHANSIK